MGFETPLFSPDEESNAQEVTKDGEWIEQKNRLHNEIQVELAKRIADRTNESPSDILMKWSVESLGDDREDVQSKRFAEYMEEHPGYYHAYEIDPEGILDELEKEFEGKGL